MARTLLAPWLTLMAIDTYRYLGFTLLLGLAAPGVAATPAEAEVDHLIAYVDQSNCAFIRNGAKGDSHAAAAHLRQKYHYARGRVETSEQFINHIASGSSMTGNPYLVECAGQEREQSGPWLRKELARFRAATQ
jgi:hypothetical protein